MPEKSNGRGKLMKKLFLSIAAGMLILAMLAVSAGAVRMPFPGTDIVTVCQNGTPAAETSLDLYRVNPFGGADTFIGTYMTDSAGKITASHLTTGKFYWQSAKTVMGSFEIVGAGYVYTEIELPAKQPGITTEIELPVDEPESTPETELPVEQPETVTEDGHEQMTYMSADGFQIRYNALFVEAREIDGHSVEFVYLAEPDGKDVVTASWIADKQPEEVLYEVTDSWGDQEAIQRLEGFFPGTDDKWGYWRLFTDADTGAVKCAIAGEYNEGVLLFVIESQVTGDEEADMTVSDTLAGIVDSVTYFDFGEQTMYSYFPGTYELTGEDGEICQVVLNEDHTGTLTFQDTVEILWGSIELNASGVTYEYTIEGESLYLNLDGEWLCFEKTAEAE